ncbi:unnamed protein product [Pedinophyceae sp. YPF-701]|nr:unnamed protein product [Pedinophyceae sp. YPF-701]
MFAKLFGAKKSGASPPPPPPPSSGGGGSGDKKTRNLISEIQRLDEQIELMEKRNTYLEKCIDEEKAKAKKHLAEGTKTGKSRALMSLKKCKMFEEQMSKNISKWENFLRLKGDLETTNTTSEYFQTMKGATAAQKAALSNVKIDEVEQVQEDIRDAQDKKQEIDDLLGQPMGVDDDDELLAELETEMEAEQQEKEVLEGLDTAALPEIPAGVPQTKQPAKVQDADEELAALSREMGITS